MCCRHIPVDRLKQILPVHFVTPCFELDTAFDLRSAFCLARQGTKQAGTETLELQTAIIFNCASHRINNQSTDKLFVFLTMANSDHADLMSIGQHCAVPHCGQVDFLPFKCDCCNQTFCLEHRTYEAHQCPKAGCKQTEIIVCPLCASAIKLKPGQDPNAAFELHQRNGCDPRNYDRVHKKKRCPVENCREKLTTINTFTCKQCGTDVCLKHRLPADHKCQEIQGEGV